MSNTDYIKAAQEIRDIGRIATQEWEGVLR